MFHRMSHQGMRAGRGMIEPAILTTLLEKPMHGYELISALEEKSHGMWRPSAGSIYPTLQLLEEKDLLVSTEQDGKKVYSLSESGQQAARDAEKDFQKFWGHRVDNLQDFHNMHHDIAEAMHLMRDILRRGSDQQKQELLEQIALFKQSMQRIVGGEKGEQ